MTKTLASLLLVFMTSVFFSENSIAADTWKVVPNKEVCMVTNMHFARPQIPVEQAGKTYYGCCENCKATIQTDAKSRVAIDPHSNKSVDKSKAVIAANETGAVLYFESRANFDVYLAKLSAKSK
jgi:YHS domain-containing protein